MTISIFLPLKKKKKLKMTDKHPWSKINLGLNFAQHYIKTYDSPFIYTKYVKSV